MFIPRQPPRVVLMVPETTGGHQLSGKTTCHRFSSVSPGSAVTSPVFGFQSMILFILVRLITIPAPFRAASLYDRPAPRTVTFRPFCRANLKMLSISSTLVG